VIFEDTGAISPTEDEFKAWKEALLGRQNLTKEEIDQIYGLGYTGYWRLSLPL
jgi:hypothetical protein